MVAVCGTQPSIQVVVDTDGKLNRDSSGNVPIIIVGKRVTGGRRNLLCVTDIYPMMQCHNVTLDLPHTLNNSDIRLSSFLSLF